MATDTPISDIVQIVKDTRETFNAGISRPQEFRRTQLNGILNLIKDKKQEIIDAMFHDLGRHEQETVLGELLPIESIVKDMISNLNSWIQPRGVATPLLQMKGLSSSQVVPEPKGVVLVISPWNYPVQLPLICIATALAAGNCVVLKPSEISEKSTQFIVNELPKYVDPRVCKIVVGGIPQSTEILKQKFDHILYTGNCAVGKIVMRAAADHLTPVTLELGGKCPVIVSDDVNMKVAARRVVWGRYFNAGQSCISCDYVLVNDKVKDKFLATVKETIDEFYGQDPKESPSFGRIINNRQWQRLVDLIQKSKEEEPNSIFVGGEFDEEKRYIAPTVILAKPDSAVMQDELFGPILPIIPVSSIDSAISFINERPKPLSLYVFTNSSNEWDKVIANTSSGGVVVNDSIVHYTVPGLPFGGVGDSGMGAYHGKVGFDSLSHLKAVLNKTTHFDLALRYPPYSDDKLKQFNRLNF